MHLVSVGEANEEAAGVGALENEIDAVLASNHLLSACIDPAHVPAHSTGNSNMISYE